MRRVPSGGWRGGLLCLALAGMVAALSAPQTRAQTRGITPVSAPRGMVASSSSHATRAGVEVLRRGGNAVDAAIAVGLALAVTYPSAGNLGGGGFMLVRKPDGTAEALDFREAAPAAARPNLYQNAAGEVIPGASTVGHRAAGIPGTVAGFDEARRRYGRLPWADLIRPAERLAEKGFPVSEALARELRSESVLAKFAESKRIFLRDGRFYEHGETFRQPDLARTLRRLREKGPREFYEGETARLLVAEMERGGGLISAADLRSYRPRLRDPLRGRYRGWEVVTMPPPSSGGIALLQMLALCERRNLGEMGPGSAATLHLQVEAMRRAFADRSHHLGDPDYVKVPVRGLLAPPYLDGLFRTIDAERATPSSRVRHGQPAPYESPQTTHYSVIDGDGMAVSVTYTLNTGYGCGVTVTGAGFLLNNEMDDFTARVGVPNAFGLIQGENNAIQPGKRPLSSMTPTILVRDGAVRYVYGSPGGPTIINTVFQVTSNLVDHRMNLAQALAHPRIHHQWLPDEIRWEPFGLAPDARHRLESMGHRFADRPGYLGDVQAVGVQAETGRRLGAADPRSPDALAAGL